MPAARPRRNASIRSFIEGELHVISPCLRQA
jgi:hypothetical protein